MLENPQLRSVDLSHVSFQNFADDNNLDGYYGNEVWTRSPSCVYQQWQVVSVDITYDLTSEGEVIYTITMNDPTDPKLKGKNLEATGQDSIVRLADPDKNKLSQQWVMRFQDDRTVIQNMKYRNFVLTGKGRDRAVLLTRYNTNGDDAQSWTPYNKARGFLEREDSRQSARAGV